MEQSGGACACTVAQGVGTWEPSCGWTMASGASGASGEFTMHPKGTSSPCGTPRRRTSSIAAKASLSRSACARPFTCAARVRQTVTAQHG